MWDEKLRMSRQGVGLEMGEAIRGLARRKSGWARGVESGKNPPIGSQ